MTEKQLPPKGERETRRIQTSFSKTGGEILVRHTSVMYGAEYVSQAPIFRRNRMSENTPFPDIKKQDIFKLVFRFLKHLINDPAFLASTLQQLHYHDNASLISITLTKNGSDTPEPSSGSINDSHSSEKVADLLELKVPELKVPESEDKKVSRRAKISIMVESSLSEVGSNSWISSQSLLNISSIKFPMQILSESLIERIFDEPEPFLINLALCLMSKFIFYSKIKLNCENVIWILSVSTIVAYKIYYDEPVEGLIDSFSSILEISQQDTRTLERYFLEQIEFQAITTNQQYYTMLSQVLQA